MSNYNGPSASQTNEKKAVQCMKTHFKFCTCESRRAFADAIAKLCSTNKQIPRDNQQTFKNQPSSTHQLTSLIQI